MDCCCILRIANGTLQLTGANLRHIYTAFLETNTYHFSTITSLLGQCQTVQNHR